MLERNKNHESHSWVQERLSAYMDSQLPSLERAKVERHLRECSQCERVFASLQWTVSLLKQVPAPPLPRSFVLPVSQQAPRSPIIGVSLLRLATAMATLLLISLIGIDALLQFGSVGAPPGLSSQRVAIAPTVVAAPPQTVLTEAPTLAANMQTMKEGFAATTAVPTTAPLPRPTLAATAMPPAVPPLPAVLPTANPPTAAAKPTFAPAATSAPAAGALQSQTGAPSRPSVRSSVVQVSPTPSAPLLLGKGAGPEKSSQDSAEATAAPLQAQPKSLEAEPTDKLVAPATGTPPTLATPTMTAAPPTATVRQEAVVQPTRPLTTLPTAASPLEDAFPVSPLRIAELGALFLAVFFGVLTLFLRR